MTTRSTQKHFIKKYTKTFYIKVHKTFYRNVEECIASSVKSPQKLDV